tara:strand:- start:10580 stop:11920 length:1341 start_codon:yes stop_codon:yes gene_type:complete
MINLKIEEINVANLPSMLRENFTPKPFRPNLPQRGLQGAMLRMPPQDGPAATANIVQNFRDNPPQQSNILRGTPPTPTPAITRQNAPNALAIQEAQEAFNDRRATAMAQQRLYANRMEGTGLVGAPLAYFINKYKENNNLSSYYDEALSQITSEAELAQFDADIRRQNEQNIRTDEQNFEQFLNRQDRAEVVADRNLDFDREGNRIETDRKYEEGKAESDRLQAILDEQAAEDRAAQNARILRGEINAEEAAQELESARNQRLYANNDQYRVYMLNLAELEAHLPTMARMAGIGDVPEPNPLFADQKVWSELKRKTSGTGPWAGNLIGQAFGDHRDETQYVNDYFKKLALTSLADYQLAPTTDVDVRLVMDGGLSPSNNERVNWNRALEIQEELKEKIAAIEAQDALLSVSDNVTYNISDAEGTRYRLTQAEYDKYQATGELPDGG